jgi:4-carboxymuconolactone decarboxylase
MTRLPGLRPNELDDDQRRLYDAIAGGDRAKDASFPLTDDDGAQR